jgi:uncharacterized protein YigE (DUF2233 family)
LRKGRQTHLEVRAGGVTNGNRYEKKRRTAACDSEVAYAATTAAPTMVSNGLIHSVTRRSARKCKTRIGVGLDGSH